MKTITIQSYCDGWTAQTYEVSEDEQYYYCPSYGRRKLPDNMKNKIRKE